MSILACFLVFWALRLLFDSSHGILKYPKVNYSHATKASTHTFDEVYLEVELLLFQLWRCGFLVFVLGIQ